MKILTYILVLSLILVLYLSCSTAPDFDRVNENDPDSKLFIPDSPSIDGVTFEIDSLKNIIFTWSPERFVDGFIIKKRYDTHSGFTELINVVSRDSVFIDSSKIFTEGTTYQLDFFRRVGESQRVLTKDPLEITLNFEPFSYIDFSYNEDTGQLYISSAYSNSNDNATLKYFDGIDVEINKSSLSENWEPFETYELDDILISNDSNSFEIIRTKNIPVFDLKLRISQFIYDSTNTKKYLKSITRTKFIHTPNDVNFEFTDELSGTLTWRNSIFSFGGVILSGSVTDTLDYPTSRVDIHFDPAPTPPIQISVQLFTGENYSATDQSFDRYPDVGLPYIEGFSTIGNQSFEFSWNTRFSEDYAGFIIEQSILPSTIYTAIDTVDKNTTSYTVNDLDQSKKYNFKVHSYTSEWSPSITVGFQNSFSQLEFTELGYGGKYTISKNGKYEAKHLLDQVTSYDSGDILVTNTETEEDYRIEMVVYPNSHRPSILDFVVSEKNNTVIFIGDNHSIDNSGDYISIYDFENRQFIFEYILGPGYNGFGWNIELLDDDKTIIVSLDGKFKFFDTELGQFVREFRVLNGEWTLTKDKKRAILCNEGGIYEYNLNSGNIINQNNDFCIRGYINQNLNLYSYIGLSSIKNLDIESFSTQETLLNLDQVDPYEIRSLWYLEEDDLLIIRNGFNSSYLIYDLTADNNFLISLPSYTKNRGSGIQWINRNVDGTYSVISYDAEFLFELKESWSLIDQESRF
tara:strand:+ start:14986 stop:17220 length:2235 start_codon:yes stop_codon:yes gene_type:complete